MDVPLRIGRVRRDYNRWVADQTLEDYALRFTAKSARRWSTFRVANTAIGGISFLALEAIGGAITLTYGFTNAILAIVVAGIIFFLTGLPISYYAARNGVDIDLLTRGAGFGYLGSTLTSLIYASFTFIFFAIEATILAKALELSTGLPDSIGLVLCALIVIPMVTFGFTFISRFQLWTQPLWLFLQVFPFVYIAFFDQDILQSWTHYTGRLGPLNDHFDLILFGQASGVVLALIVQVGEQVDFLRFLPEKQRRKDRAWWVGMLTTGPGWAFLGVAKLIAGSFLAYLALKNGVPPSDMAEPTHMYEEAFARVFEDRPVALGLAAVFVVISQLKINVTNSYAGSIAWSNFFSRLTHSHPGRVVWVVFNVVIALLLMEFGIYKNLESTLGLYSLVAVAWVGTIVADLVVNKPLGLSPKGIEFKRAHLYDLNPVGFGSMLIASSVSISAEMGVFGPTAAALSSYMSLILAFVSAPLIALATRGRYYIARPATRWTDYTKLTCCICELPFEAEDMAHCPVYAGPICSLCCTLDARCNDVCKTGSRLQEQMLSFFSGLLPIKIVNQLNSSLGHYLGLQAIIGTIISAVLWSVYTGSLHDIGPPEGIISGAMLKIFLVLFLISGVVCWLLVLAHDSRRVAQEESARQTHLLMQEIEAHERTDMELQAAKEVAEAANLAKSRYLIGICHEFRTPLNAILGYAQLIDRSDGEIAKLASAVRTIRRSGEHLAGLVEGLLDIAKIEAGRLQLQNEVIAFPDFLEQIVDMFKLQAETSQIGFVFEQPMFLPDYVRIDAKRLRQVLINLLSNAIKFTPHGEVRLRVKYRNEVAEFLIEDTGIGIDEVDFERVFIPFERIENPQQPWTPGTGLGLTITKLITEMMGGEISLKSTVGRGSTFTVRLHLPIVTDLSGLPAPNSAVITGYVGPRLTVLVVDDEAAHRQLMIDVLGPLGISVHEAGDAALCFEVLGRLNVDVVILDITMPGMNGWDVAKVLREDHLSTSAIIMVSADAAEEHHANASFRYHDAYVVKPIMLNTLLEVISDCTGIVWVRDGRAEVQSVSPPLTRRSGALTRRDVVELLNLARIGFIRGMTDKLDEIAAQSLARAQAVAPLRALLADVQIEAFISALEETLDDIIV